MEANEVMEKGLTFGLIFKTIKKFWIIILIATVLFAAIGGGYTLLFKENYYRASASFWVKGNNTSYNALMAANYSELVDTDSLLRRAVSNKDGISTGKPLNEEWNCSADEAVRVLRSVLSSSKASEETCIFTVTAASTNREVTYQAIDAIQYAYAGYIAEELDPDGIFSIQILNQVHSIEDVSLVKRPIIKNTVFFAIIGFIASLTACIFAVIYRPELIKNKEQIPAPTMEQERKDREG